MHHCFPAGSCFVSDPKCPYPRAARAQTLKLRDRRYGIARDARATASVPVLATVILRSQVARLKQQGALSSHELSAETIVGRAPSAMIRVQQSYVSSHHASLRWTERKCWEVKDLQSKNGTYVNRERIAAGEKVKL